MLFESRSIQHTMNYDHIQFCSFLTSTKNLPESFYGTMLKYGCHIHMRMKKISSYELITWGEQTKFSLYERTPEMSKQNIIL